MSERFGILSRDIWALRGELARTLDADPVRIVPTGTPRYDEVVGWDGRGGRAARLWARALGLPFRPIRTGPLRSVRPQGEPPASLVVPRILPGDAPMGNLPQEPRNGLSRDALEQLRRLRLAWRNDGRDRLPFGIEPGDAVNLVVLGREFRAASSASAMIRGARDDDPAARIVLIADSRETASLAHRVAARHPGTMPVAGVNPWALLDIVGRVYAVDGDLARLAIIAGRDTRLRAGASTTATAHTTPEEIFATTYLDAPVYFDAWSRKPVDFAAAADQLAWRRDRFLDNDRPTICVGVSRWKRAQIARMLDGPDGPPSFAATSRPAVAGASAKAGRIVAWETRMPADLPAACAEAGVPLWRMEDGFLRSVGLGAAFLPGASAVLDGRGMYYDPRAESDLEHILANTVFDADVLARAAALRATVVGLRLSKYNVGGEAALAEIPQGRRVVLVPGQVEDDASILFGSRRVSTNLGLIQAARRRCPDAYLIFKPHPDVEAGLRRGRVADADALSYTDRVVAGASIVDLLERADEVETMTSLAGFEALMRGKRVVVHGQPFYAGWGLSEDLDPPPRRTRRLTLDELVAGALILYPRYLDPVTGLRCPPEILAGRLAEARDRAVGRPASGAALRAAYVRVRYALLGPLAGLLRRARGATRRRGDGPSG